MPLYDYRCLACGREVEVMHGINDVGPDTCQHCGGAMRKALSPPAIHFKGSGWAKKDAASARKAKPAASSKADKGSSSKDKPAAGSDGSGADKSSGGGSESKATTTAGSSTD
jgi:putative FmdB family regulatory protein